MSSVGLILIGAGILLGLSLLIVVGLILAVWQQGRPSAERQVVQQFMEDIDEPGGNYPRETKG